jgi:cell division septum initiation protein DivIVA
MTRPIPDRLDRIAADVEELKRRQQTARIQQMTADMASEIERIKGENWKEPEDLVDFAKQGEFKEGDIGS